MATIPKNLRHETARGRVRQWRTHKLRSLAMAVALQSADPERHRKRAARMHECANRVDFTHNGKRLEVANAYRCKVRLCAICDATNARRDFFVLASRVLAHSRRYPRAMPIMLTLTVPNVVGAELPAMIGLILGSFRKLMRMNVVKRCVLGWHRSLEVTFNPERGDFHPHVHALVFMQPGYFERTGGLYITQPTWLSLWRKATGLPVKILDVRRVGTDRDGILEMATDGLFELTKYLVKPAGFYTIEKIGFTVDKDLVDLLHRAVFRRRLRDVAGTLRKIPKPDRRKGPSDTELAEAHAPDEIYIFAEWIDADGVVHGPDYWQRAPPGTFRT